ncbi:MAG: cysteine--tRNA ligase [Calditrichaeota bacterium]|nr:MAG: cysteine--tRNA ligase [Calditrichota bacterium]
MSIKKNNLTIFNSLTRKKEVFEPLHPGFVGIYVCGPTVYGDSHLGHAKSYISFDVVVRYFRYLGYKVRYVQNITDVGHLQSDADEGDDKIQVQARLERLEPMEVVERYTRSYFEDMDALNVLRPDISPRASGHIPEQIEMTQTLLEKGYAYEVNGNVYFSVEKYPAYGKLSGRSLEDIKSGTRVEVAGDKKNPADFALWKKADPEHIMRWKSPWGEGYPGWHLECSCMSSKYLGDTFDIHGGGMENKFPHHECEIAQSEAAHDKPFARYWMHNNMITVDGVKMGKSLGNFVTIKKALQSHSPMEIRFFILGSHYRSTLDFSEDALHGAARGWQRLQKFYQKLANTPSGNGEDDKAFVSVTEQLQQQFTQAMDDDFNTPRVLAALFDFIKQATPLLEKGALSEAVLDKTRLLFKEITQDVLGLTPELNEDSVSDVELNAVIEVIIGLRQRMRREKNWEMADYIRDELARRGIIIRDTPEGTVWERQV